MVYGAGGSRRAGDDVIVLSPGISLKQEGISYIAGAELPRVIVNIARGGPGLGDISPAQADYFQATKRRRPRRLPPASCWPPAASRKRSI